MAAQLQPDQFLDPVWRINNLYSCISKSGRVVPFRLWDEQREFLTNIHTRNDILKCRQRGFTTLMCIVQLDDCIFTPTTRAAVIAHRLDDAKVIFRDKVKFPYDALDDGLKASVPAIQDSADTMTFANNSSFRVSTSVRSGTLQWLHVSEYGKICAQFPDKAREIKTGSFPAAEAGVITVESTAEGESGDFFDITAEAQRLLNVGARLTRKDFKFFFYPWWRAKEYILDRTNVPISPEDEDYFARIGHEIGAIPSLSVHFDGFTQAQKNWWVTEQAHLGSDMKREYPSTPKEAFEQAIEGAIFAEDIAIAHKHKRIGNFPFDKTRPVNTFWDLGHSDETAIWLEQDVGSQPTMVGYYENSGEGIEHYLRWLKAWGDERQAVFGKHYLPHDGDRKSIWTPEGSMVVMSRLGFRPNIVNRTNDKWEAVKIGRRKFGTVAFDEAGTKEGMQRLKAYRKEWDDRRSVWKDHPHHGPESNGCLVAGSLVKTERGPVPIEGVLPGDKVWTPNGFSLVTHSGPTKIASDLISITLAKGMKLTCTPEHKILTTNGFVCASGLTTSHRILTGREWTSRLVSFVSRASNTGYRAIITGEKTGARTSTSVHRPSIGQFGNMSMVLFRQIMKFTTSMSNTSIAVPVTSNVFTSLFISGCTPYSVSLRDSSSLHQNLHAHALRSGTQAPMASNGTKSTGSVLGKAESRLRSFAKSAVSRFSRLALTLPSGAQRIVDIRTDAANPGQWVFDLTVDRNACYQANGMLVSNSDAFLTFAQSGHSVTAEVTHDGDVHKSRYYEREEADGSWLTY